MTLILPQRGRIGQSGVVTDLSFITNNGANSTVTNFSTSVSIGTADTNRHVIIGITTFLNGSTPPYVSTMTLGGSSCTFIARIRGTSFGRYVSSELWRIAYPTGTTATLAVDWGANVSTYEYGIWRLIHADGIPYDSNTAVVATDDGYPISAAVNTVNAGVIAACASRSGSSGLSHSFTNVTQDYQVDRRTGEDMMGGHNTNSSASSTTVSSNIGEALAVASWD